MATLFNIAAGSGQLVIVIDAPSMCMVQKGSGVVICIATRANTANIIARMVGNIYAERDDDGGGSGKPLVVRIFRVPSMSRRTVVYLLSTVFILAAGGEAVNIVACNRKSVGL